MDIHQAGSVPVLGVRRRGSSRASLFEHMEDGGRPGPLLDAPPLATPMSACVALRDLLGKPFVDPTTPAAAGPPVQRVTRLPSVRQTCHHRLQGLSATRLAVTSTGAHADWRNDRADFGDFGAEIRVSLVAHQPPGRGPSP